MAIPVIRNPPEFSTASVNSRKVRSTPAASSTMASGNRLYSMEETSGDTGFIEIGKPNRRAAARASFDVFAITLGRLEKNRSFNPLRYDIRDTA
jgi:hypothetical protein